MNITQEEMDFVFNCSNTFRNYNEAESEFNIQYIIYILDNT